MAVFHYVANQLTDVPLFECSNIVLNTSEGAIYNDFDFRPESLVDCDSITFSQTTNLGSENSNPLTDLIPDEAVEHAILDADATEGLLYEHLVFETELMDATTTNPRDVEYLTKVYKLVTLSWKEIHMQMRAKTLEIYQMRHRNNWKGADSVYDAWLLAVDLRRSWFPYKKFLRLFPDWKKAREEIMEATDESDGESSTSEEDGEKPNLEKFVGKPLPVVTIELSSDDDCDSKEPLQKFVALFETTKPELFVISSDDEPL